MRTTIIMTRLLIVALLSYGSAQVSVHAMNAMAEPEGTLSFYKNNGELQCVFPAKSGTYYFGDTAPEPCSIVSDKGFFKLTNFPSATRIWFLRHKPPTLGPAFCNASAEMAYGWLQLLTIKNPTTTDPTVNNGLIRISDLKTFNAGDVVVPGVRLVELVPSGASTVSEVNCIIVQVSPLESTGSPSKAVDPAKLTLEGANGENHCSLDFKTQDYVFKGDNHCKNDEAIKIELEHAPSASNILLFDDYTCDRSDDGNYFWVYLRTIKEDVSTLNLIDLDDIAAAPIGSVVAPGIRLMDRYQKPGESMKKRTSCVQIQVDAPPLPPVKSP